MFPSEMDNGQSMLDVNIDTNLLSDFFEENNGVPNISDVDCASSAFDWADDFISSASTPYSIEGGSERSPATAGSLPSTSPASSVVETQASTTTPLPQVAQVVVTAGGVIQQLPTTLASQQILHKSSNIIQGISPGTQHFVVKADANGQLQFQPTPGSSPAPTQQFSVPSPAISRSLTPSQSPAPSCSPHISRSITPNQPNIQQALSSSPSPNILHLATPQSQPQVQITNTVPIQSIIPNPSQNASIIPGQAVLSGHAHNIVHTQNAVIQNPNVVNLNVATHVLCGNSQQVGQQPAGQIQSNIQGLPVTVQNTVGLQGNQVSLQGTIIQTPGGKSILIPNQQLGGHQINLGAVHQQVLQGQQLMQGGGTAVLQNTPGSVGVGNVIRLAPQPGQDKPASVVPPNISLVNIGGAQGQQILIQRAPHPAQGQPQNIIFRTVPHPNLIQIQGSQAGQANLQGASLQAASQISQQILNQATSQSVQYQQVLPGGAQPQQVKLVGGQGSHPTSQGVTLNLAGQSLNLLSGQNLNLQQIQGLATSTVGSMPGVQGIQLQQNGSQYIVQPAHTQLGTQPQTVNVSSINQSTNIVSKALISSGLSQVINTQIKQGQEPKSSNSVSESPTVTTTSKSKSKKSKSNPDGQVKGSPQQLAQNFQKIQIPISQFIATASNAAGIHTAQSTPTAVTTTVTQAMVQVPAQLTLANTLSGSQIVSSVQSKSSVGIISTPSTASQIKIQPQVIKSGPPNVTLAPQGTAFQTSNTDPLKLHRVQQEISKLLNQPNLTQDQIQKLGNLQQCLKDSYPPSVIQTSQQNAGTVSPKPIKPLVQASLTAQPMVGQPPIAQPQVVVATAATQIKTEPGTQPISLQSLVSQPGIVVQSQAGGTGVIQLAVPQQTTVTAPATQMITTVAQTGQPQYLQTVIKHGSPTKTIKMAPGGTTQVIQIQSSPVTTATPTRPAVPAGTTVIRTPPPGKMPISATPSLPTQIKIANQMLTLNLTSQQKEKLQQHLGRMTMEQQEMFLKQQQHTLVKLQQQQQQHIHQQIQVIRTTSPQTKPQLLVANPPGKIPITVQQIDKGINQIKVGVDAVQTSTPNRPTKRPAPSDVSKGTLSIHQQLGKDQQHAVNPDTKSPFKDYKEACRRLLRYHVFQHHGPKQDAFKKAENVFDTVSEDLLKRSHTMMNKYRLLLLEESMRDRPSAEMVMIQRMLNQDLTAVIKKEKDVIKADPDSFVPMPTKYLKKEKKEEDSAAETSALDTSAVKSETFTESEYSDHDMSESLHQSSASVESERMSVKSSPIVPPGKVKLVIRNDGRGFTSSLKTKTPVKTEPPSPRYGQVTPEETPPKGVVKGESLYINEFQSDHYADERDDLNMSGERGDESGNVLSRELSSANASSDLDTTDLQAGLREPSFQAQLAQSCVSEPGGEERLQAFHHSGDDPLLKVKGSPVASAVSGDSRLEVHQPHYSDISITDVSGDYPSVLSPIQKPLDSGGTVLGEFASQISEDFDPSSFDFPEALTGNLCSQSASVSTVSEPARTAFSSITADDGFHHQMDLGNSRTNQLNVASSPIVAVAAAAAAAAAHDVYDSDDDGLSFTTAPRPHTAAPHGNIEEIDNAVSSIMDFDDVSSDGNVADLSTISSEKDLGSNADVLSSKDLPQNEMMFSPESGPSNSQDENNQSDGMELDASFESDGNDPQNHMMNAQMQSAIDSILSLNQVEDPAAVADFMDQSGSMTSFYDNQLTEVTDTSQDESEYYGEEGGGESEDKPEESGSGDKDGGETSMEDDLDAAVQSILM